MEKKRKRLHGQPPLLRESLTGRLIYLHLAGAKTRPKQILPDDAPMWAQTSAHVDMHAHERTDIVKIAKFTRSPRGFLIQPEGLKSEFVHQIAPREFE